MQPGQTITRTFKTLNEAGQLVNADNLPAAALYRNGILTAIVVSVSPIGAGVYQYSFTIPADWQSGDQVAMHFSAVIDSIPVHAVKDLPQVEVRSRDNIYDRAAIAAKKAH